MALTDRKKYSKQSKPRPQVEQEIQLTRFPNNNDMRSNTNSKQTEKMEEDKKISTNKYLDNTLTFDIQQPFDSKQRKTIKVDPDVKSVIEIFGDFEGKKEYEMIREMTKYYYENNFDERAQRIIGSLQSTKFIN